MVRDELMQRMVCRDEEPITPFIERARFLYEKCGISSVLVAGSSGAYFYIADTIVQKLPDPALPSFQHVPSCNMAPRRDDRLKTRTRRTDDVQLGHENIDLHCLKRITDHAQTAALSCILALVGKNLLDSRKTMTLMANAICALMEERGTEAVNGQSPAGSCSPASQRTAARLPWEMPFFMKCLLFMPCACLPYAVK